MKIDVKEPSQSNDGKPNVSNKLFQKGRPFGYYRKRSCVYNKDGTFCGQVGSNVCCLLCSNGSCCSNERCARRMINPNGFTPYTDVSVYETDLDINGNTVVTKRQPIPQVKTITAPRSVYNNSTTYKKQKYSYSITEMLKFQKTSYKEQQKNISYRNYHCDNGCI